MTSSRINNTAILLALEDWERRSIPPPIDHDTLVTLAGACVRIGLRLVKAAEGRRSVEVERLCASAVFSHSNRALTPSSFPGSSPFPYVPDMVTLAVAMASMVVIWGTTNPGVPEVPPRSWRQKARRIADWLRSTDQRRLVIGPEIPNQGLGSEIQTRPAPDENAASALSETSKTGDQSRASLPQVEGSAGTKRKLSPSVDDSRPSKRPKTVRSPLFQEEKEVEGGGKEMVAGDEKEVGGGEEEKEAGGGEKEEVRGEKSTTSHGKTSLVEEETLLEGPTRQALVRAESQEALKSAGPQV